MAKLKIRFESDQEHQVNAIESIAGVFSGHTGSGSAPFMGDTDAKANLAPYESFEEGWLHGNLVAVQQQNGLQSNLYLETDFDETMLEDLSLDTWRYFRYTVEMETGTGKTYIYLRSIFELYRRYNFSKFVIVVPSVAIYEGVVKSVEIMQEHFCSLYGNERISLLKYDGQHLSKLRSFSQNTSISVMVITLDSFNKKSNVIYKPSERLPGDKLPVEYIQDTRPILILDESQNYLSPKAKKALRMLKPLAAFCFSATPKEKHNLIFRLGPVEAFRQNLVKRIEVLGVSEENWSNPQLQLALEGITEGYTPRAKVKVLVNVKGRLELKVVEIGKGDNLELITKNEIHRGMVVEEIDRAARLVRFTNQEVLGVDEKPSLTKRDIFRVQIEETVKFHLNKQERLQARGVKVLSLFFIDRVANYQNDGGMIRELFEEAFDKWKGGYEFFKNMRAEDVHRGYFAQKKDKQGKVTYLDTHIENESKTKADKELEQTAYQLIMKQKERLLSFEEKVSFIFAHSALKEGWDNPNVFQICTLNQTTSETKKRQEIGRGLRICVNQQGERVMDESVNILTVVANERYEEYVSNLQHEYRETGDMNMPPPSKAKPYHAKRNNRIFTSDAFKKFWDKLSRKTTYEIRIDDDRVAEDCITKLNAHKDYPAPKITISRGKFIITEFRLELKETKLNYARIQITVKDTDENHSETTNWFPVGAEIGKIARDDRLKGFKVVQVEGTGQDGVVHFGDKGTLTKEQPIRFHSERGQQTSPRVVMESEVFYPVFNIIDRTARETMLTRKSVLRIFKGLRDDVKRHCLLNPEGFVEILIREIKHVLADHVADSIEYTLTEDLETYKLDIIFPETKQYAQKELLPGTEHSMYDQVQIDSEVEKRFVEFRLQEDDKQGNIALYFKFPNSFKISMPKVIQNYVPDWGVVRFREDKHGTIQLVRETKGTIHLDRLQFPSEVRKIKCAQKHFAALGISYRAVDDKVVAWWEG